MSFKVELCRQIYIYVQLLCMHHFQAVMSDCGTSGDYSVPGSVGNGHRVF